MDCDGSILFRLTWKRQATPSGRQICRLRASARRTSDSGCSSWPTPGAQERDESFEQWRERDARQRMANPNLGARRFMLSTAARLASWPTPEAGGFNLRDEGWIARRQEQRARRINENGFGLTLGMAASLAPWPTPQSHDQRGAKSTDAVAAMRAAHRGGVSNLNETAQLAGWTSPMARDGRSELDTPKQRGKVALELSKQAKLAGWPTPTRGLTSSGSPAETERPGQLNAAFSLWLMGYPIEWAHCAAQVTRSCLKRRPNSSPRSSKRTQSHDRD